MTSVQSRFHAVESWLRDVLNKDETPDFEIDECTLSHLERLKAISQWRTELCNLKTEMTRRMDEEREKESETVEETLMQLIGGEGSLTKAGQQDVQALSTIAVTLNTADFSQQELTLALSDLALEEYDESRSLSVEEGKNRELMRSVQEYLAKARQYRSQMERAEDERDKVAPLEEVTSQRQTVAFLQKKCEQYESTAARRREESESLGLSTDPERSEIGGSALRESAREIAALSSELDRIQEELAPFEELPPDRRIAESIVVETEAELRRVEEEVEERLAGTDGAL